MMRRAGAPARGDPTGPIPVVGKGEEEDEEDGMGLCLPATLKNCLPHRRGISILEKLIKTCPVWLQLSLGQAEVARILHREAAGVSGGASHLVAHTP
ncbi:ras and Rab interactor 3-like [Cebus imitator]|uniref:ras and Rab interactor 3-like n=1 Tax=Cebus imitator TaxID=2715852 RepID=UPI001898F86F|nr:ras and Rab interactor 3-like [Cebus imitator]